MQQIAAMERQLKSEGRLQALTTLRQRWKELSEQAKAPAGVDQVIVDFGFIPTGYPILDFRLVISDLSVKKPLSSFFY